MLKFALSRFSKTFFCKISKTLKQIVPADVAKKMHAARDVIKHCFSYGNCIDNNSIFPI